MKDCEVCYKIICRSCGWEATDSDVLLIQGGMMTKCPDCGWMPGNISENEAKTI